MKFTSFPFSVTDFANMEGEVHPGITGEATWKTFYKDDVRIRQVTYSPEYLADHWCSKGHVLFCVEGELETELEDGSKHILRKGMLYTVGDNSDAHRSFSKNGCMLFIVD